MRAQLFRFSLAFPFVRFALSLSCVCQHSLDFFFGDFSTFPILSFVVSQHFSTAQSSLSVRYRDSPVKVPLFWFFSSLTVLPIFFLSTWELKLKASKVPTKLEFWLHLGVLRIQSSLGFNNKWHQNCWSFIRKIRNGRKEKNEIFWLSDSLLLGAQLLAPPSKHSLFSSYHSWWLGKIYRISKSWGQREEFFADFVLDKSFFRHSPQFNPIVVLLLRRAECERVHIYERSITSDNERWQM